MKNHKTVDEIEWRKKQEKKGAKWEEKKRTEYKIHTNFERKRV